ncbi:uncharacterized protein LOC106869129 isoform X2 [Octopus bimaculoides]|uniref:uncharacterized protein LOC106869129 isoform X2 n=1 Tax=Octopus bimaculoides TaxID=37653 RepID=UPI00071D0387|nr:uncharacterized protein LOC106869129 isoform X2 [Octopus bimaculoides]|eukprot:XP_014770181.1 PREDICTED: uncharacterized protein LOC106869129 isoform X2 [Octopus bimaculoides]
MKLLETYRHNEKRQNQCSHYFSTTMACKISEDIHYSTCEDSVSKRTSVSYQSYIALLDEMTNLRKIIDSYKNFSEKPVKFDACVQTTEALEYEDMLRSLASAYDAKQEDCKQLEMKLKDSEEIIKELYEKLDNVMQDLKSEKEECDRLKQLTTATGTLNTMMASTSRSCSTACQLYSKPCIQPSELQVDCALKSTVRNNECLVCQQTFKNEADLKEHQKRYHLNK